MQVVGQTDQGALVMIEGLSFPSLAQERTSQCWVVKIVPKLGRLGTVRYDAGDGLRYDMILIAN